MRIYSCLRWVRMPEAMICIFPNSTTPRQTAVGPGDWTGDRYGGLFAKVQTHHWSIQGFSIIREKGIPTASWDVLFNDPRYKTTDRRRFLEAKVSGDRGSGIHWSARASVDDYLYSSFYPYDLPQRERSRGLWVDAEGQLRWDASRAHRLTVGAKLQNSAKAEYRLWTAEGDVFNGRFPYSLISVYLQEEYRMSDDLSAFLGISRDAYSSGNRTLTPKIAVVYRPFTGTSTKWIVADGFRAPNVYERNIEETGVQKRNLGLQPENMRTFEWVLEQRVSKRWLASFSAYRYDLRNLIDMVPDPADSLLQYRNISRVRAWGGEAEISGRMAGDVSAFLRVSLQRSENRETGGRLTNSPSTLAHLGLTIPVCRSVVAAAEVQGESSRRTVRGDRTPGFLLVHANIAGIQPLPRVFLSFKVQNVFGVRIWVPGGLEHRMDAIEQNGRTWSARMNVSI
jgi:outer membrane receptor protein involved in Fe transport